MITIIHGENTALSRKYFSDSRFNAKNPITFEGSTLSLSSISQSLQGQGLFVEKYEIFIEEFISKKKSSKEIEEILVNINKYSESNTVILWEPKKLTKKQLELFKGAIVKQFDLPKSLFLFLDNLRPDNFQAAVVLLHNVLATQEAELVFFMIVRQIRILLALTDRDKETIDEVARLAPWQKAKLQKQSSAIGYNKLHKLYAKLYLIEAGIKTGTLITPLVQAIDFFLMEI